MADLKLIGAVAIKVRPDTSRFREETQKGIDEQLGPSGDRVKPKVKVDVAADTAKAKVEITKLEDEVNGKELTLNVGLDYDSVQKARRQIDQALESLKNTVIKTTMDRPSLEEAKRKIAELSKDAKVDFKFVRDEAGYQAVLDKIKAIRAEKGLTSTWQFGTDTASLREAELKALSALRRIKDNATIEVKYDKTSFDSIKSAIGEIDSQLAKNHLMTLKTKMDDKSLEEARAKLMAKLDNSTVTVKINEDKTGYETVLSRIRAIQNEKLAKDVTFKTDDASLLAAEGQVRLKLQQLKDLSRVSLEVQLDRYSLEKAESDAKDLKKKIDDMKASIEINDKGTLAVSAQLNYIGRNRVVEYFASVNARSIAVAEGTLKSLGGLNVLHEATGLLESMFTKFDEVALKVGGLASAFGSLADVALYAGTAIFKVGDGVLQSIGILAAAPAAVTAFAASIFVYTAAFDNFKKAFSSNAKTQATALAALPPVARETVDSIKGLYGEIQKPVQDAFWDRMGTSLKDAIQNLIPTLKDGLVGLSPSIGAFTAGMLNSFNKIALNGDLKAMFGNLKLFFDNVGKASEPFFDAFNKFGIKGSELLPRFGQWLDDLSVRFDKYATKASADGTINRWITNGVNSLQEMWKVGGDVIDIFKAITRTADTAGTGGLGVFEDHLHTIAQTMLGEPWQSNMSRIFAGARAGASELNTGFKDLTGAIGESAHTFGGLLTLFGSIGGGALTDLSKIFGLSNFQSGVTAAFQGMLQLVRELSPAATAVGNILGNLGKIAGAAFSNAGGILSQMFTLVDQAFSKVADNLAAISPKLMNSVGGVFAAATPVILAAADALNHILDIIALIPNSFSVAGVAATAFFGLRALGSKFFESLSGTKYFSDLKSNWLEQQALAGRTTTTFREVDGELKKVTVPTEKFSATKAVFGDLTSQVGQTRQSMMEMYHIAQQGEEGMSPLKAGLTTVSEAAKATGKNIAGSLLSFVGGGWGLAFLGASLAVGAFAQAQTDAKAEADSFTQTLNEQTGAITNNTNALIAKNIASQSNDGFYAMNTGAKSASETLKVLGKSVQDTSDIVAKGGKPYDDMVGLLKEGKDAISKATVSFDNNGFAVKGNSDALDAWAKKMHISKDALSQLDLEGLIGLLEKERGGVQGSVNGWNLRNDSVDKGAKRVADFNTAMQTYNDTTATADSRTRALKQALDILNGKQPDIEQAQLQVNDAMRAMEPVSQLVDGAMVKVGGAFYDAQGHVKDFTGVIDKNTGAINTAGEAGATLFKDLKQTTDGVLATATAMKDAHRPVEEIGKFLDDSRQHFIDMGKAAGLNGDEVAKAYDHMIGANPKDLITTVTAQGVDDAKAKVQDYQSTLDKLDAKKAVAKIAGDDTDLGTKLGNSYGKLDDFNKVVATATADLDPAQAEAKRQVLIANLVNLAETNPTVKANMDPALFAERLKTVNQDIDELRQQKPTPEVKLAIQAALDEAQRLRNDIAQKAASMTVRLVADASDVNSALDYIQVKSATGVPQGHYANGGILDGFLKQFFANGGFSVPISTENHIAQIAYPTPAVPVRVWAEEETQGEAYIPLSAAKRTRSTEILTQVADQFGYTLTQKFANGGSTVQMDGNPQAASRPALQIQIDQFNQHANDTIQDVGRGIMREARKAGVFATEAF